VPWSNNHLMTRVKQGMNLFLWNFGLLPQPGGILGRRRLSGVTSN
jgi:hypothetical protein